MLLSMYLSWSRCPRSTPTRVRRALALGVALAASGATAAHAQAVQESRDFPIERFRWTFARTGLLGAEWAGVPEPGSWDAGLWMGTANDPLVLVRTDEHGDSTELSALVAQRTTAALLGSYALQRVELGLELPLILAQSRGDIAPGVEGMLASISGAGLGDLRVASKLALLRQPSRGVDVAVLASLTLPTAGQSDYRGERGVSLAPELAVAHARGAWRSAGNLGYRARRNASLLDLRVTDELFGVLALGRQLGGRAEASAALSWATAAASPLSADNQDHAEAQVGLTLRAGPLQVTGIGGAGLNRGFGTPDWRAVLAVRFGAVQARGADRDGDGVHDVSDACAGEAEDRDGWQDRDGCPDPDNDGDGVMDLVDRAPLDPEDLDRWQDDDGAPDPDDDGDGVADATDQCPRQAEAKNGWQDEDGCPDVADRDGDLVEDTPSGPDVCPEAPEDRDGWQDEDGCPDLDNDGDGLADLDDRCPTQAGVPEARGCPDPDRDGDGLVDRLDNCPDDKGALSNRGCAQKQLVVLAEDKLEILDIVYFELDRDRILPRSFPLLDNVATVLRAHPEISKISVEGHTDSQGDDAYNLELSRRRAAAVVRYLVARGLEAARLSSEGFGETRPIVDNGTKQGRAQNRRVEFKLDASAPPGRVRQYDFSDDTIESELPRPGKP
ncbi:MAG: OmpA family protein [Myxococcales bacterium]|nr:OmpA family protein [Myxococcales bacterium]